ncbi:hypothetical protein LPB67_07215 [Undibacterium sp. Jales W-56]|uniref:hypothetical protein n=1 Tax=Undibacterium sp. Jales W-56 TaxID=2897325 RepID=UPI0021D2D038|nr:hypothetical protein [Undibacterium sp. Jales W-56]MCU6433565.1 hypothetical protein [Undibacterium sp. Jales W-56]
MSKLHWQTCSATELAALLQQSTMEKSSAVGKTTVYQVTHEGNEKLILSLVDGHVLVVKLNQIKHPGRRLIDNAKK